MFEVLNCTTFCDAEPHGGQYYALSLVYQQAGMEQAIQHTNFVALTVEIAVAMSSVLKI